MEHTVDGREIVPLDEALAMLPGGDEIHTFRGGGGIMIGADWPRDNLIEAMKSAKEIEFSGPMAASMGHKLCFKDEHGFVFVQTV